MKVGIMTFHGSNNCGSMLQAFALQNVLRSYGYNNEIIDYSNKAQQHMYAFLRRPQNHHDVLHDISTIVFWRVFKTHYSDYIQFKSEQLVLSTQSMSEHDELNSIKENYEIIITGSDQVWNTKCPDADDAYYLDFYEKKKIAYAPSFGNTNLNKEQNKDIYINYLQKFDAISIREDNGSRWIEQMIGNKCKVLLDPTLLLDKQRYMDIIAEEPLIKQKYIFYYAFSYSDEVNTYVRKISKKYNLPVYIIDARGWLKKAWKYGIKLCKHSGPYIFLNLIFNAEIVLTTSFHGTAFSIIGEKRFWFIDSKMRNVDDDRALTLLRKVGLQDRMIFGEELINSNVMREIEYDKVYEKLQLWRNDSMEWLINNLKKCGGEV